MVFSSSELSDKTKIRKLTKLTSDKGSRKSSSSVDGCRSSCSSLKCKCQLKKRHILCIHKCTNIQQQYYKQAWWPHELEAWKFTNKIMKFLKIKITLQVWRRPVKKMKHSLQSTDKWIRQILLTNILWIFLACNIHYFQVN